jgi:membrane-associated phospholipid phosphatase
MVGAKMRRKTNRERADSGHPARRVHWRGDIDLLHDLLHRSQFVRALRQALLPLVLLAATATAQASDSSAHDKTFLTRRDLLVGGLAIGATGIMSIFDDDIAIASREQRYQSAALHRFSSDVSKVNETTLTVAGLLTYGIGRLTKQETVTDIALHTTESVVLASLASQVIRGPLGRTRPHVTGDTNQYDFHFGQGFRHFENRAFPSIHTSSGMAVATALTMELHRRHAGATPFVAPLLFAAGILPGISRIQLDQHWASDIVAGAFMGVFAGYKVVSYSHDHPNNRFDRILLKASVMPDPYGGWRVGFGF